ncbi:MULTISPECIES: hypothetical protein [Burkholderia]|uniref:hypothetical protein n=1 Tax=Burkholderia TaxID=32008 RepID=UPI0018D23483|nr:MULTISPECIES: hypothetical protein [Burkholderia]
MENADGEVSPNIGEIDDARLAAQKMPIARAAHSCPSRGCRTARCDARLADVDGGPRARVESARLCRVGTDCLAAQYLKEFGTRRLRVVALPKMTGITQNIGIPIPAAYRAHSLDAPQPATPA